MKGGVMKHYIERYVFIGFALVFIYKGSAILMNAKVEMHKIEGFLCLLIASVLVAGAYIINAIRLLHKETKGRRTMDAHVQNLTERLYRMEKAS
jgi:hypothetical protein